MRACRSCRHWEHPRSDFTQTVEPAFGESTTETWKAAGEADQTYGSCLKIQMGPALLDELPLAICMDGSQYKADLFTQAGFGCALWEEKL
jgi:hypothetical protein